MEGPLASDLAAEVQLLRDERDITRLLQLYCRATDRGDRDLLGSVYTEDAWEDHGDTFRGPAREFVDMVVGYSSGRFKATMHTLRNILVDVEGDAARAESQCVAYHVEDGSDGQPALMTFACRYLDHLVRSTDGWRIDHRVVVREWQRREPMLGEQDQAPGYLTGARSHEDWVYAKQLPVRRRTAGLA